MDLDSFRWILMDFDRLRCIGTGLNGFRWIQKELDGLSWAQTGLGGFRLSEMG